MGKHTIIRDEEYVPSDDESSRTDNVIRKKRSHRYTKPITKIGISIEKNAHKKKELEESIINSSIKLWEQGIMNLQLFESMKDYIFDISKENYNLFIDIIKKMKQVNRIDKVIVNFSDKQTKLQIKQMAQ